MICKSVHYLNFRNIEGQQITFSPGTNIIRGENAQGKTNALEGIYLCAGGRSHRTVHEKEFIRFGQSFAEVGLTYEDSRRENKLLLRYAGNRKSCQKNSVPIRRMSEFIGNFRAVLFTPEHLSIVKDGPSLRRTFLDSAISQLSASYVSALQTYQKCLMQRNKLLQSAQKGDYGTNLSALAPLSEVWALQMAQAGASISLMRQEYTEKLCETVKVIFSDMTGGKETPEIVYQSLKSEEELQKCFTEHLEREVRVGSTLHGIHKDDLLLTINGKDARSYASQGQQRSLALAMKLAEGEISKVRTGEYPVFLFDDILSELDASRKAYVMGGISGKQVILTTCEEITYPDALIIPCKEGRYGS